MKEASAIPASGKVLVIDDNPVIQRAVYFQLRDQGYKVLMSGDLTEALTIVRAERPDAIVLDIKFPNEHSVMTEARDGYWAAKWLSKMAEAKNIPVILISTADPAEAEPRALAAGAAAFLPKPLDKDKLVATIQKFIAQNKPAAPATFSLKMAS
jgi:CheY-like chemotaxis protein